MAFGALQLIALARYAGQVEWNRPAAGLYVAFLASVLAVGVVGLVRARRV